MLHGIPRLTPLVKTSKTILNKKRLSAESWCRPTFTSKPSVVPTPLLTLVFTSLYISFISRTYFSGTIFSLKHLHSTSLGNLSYAFSRSCSSSRHEPKLLLCHLHLASHPLVHNTLPDLHCMGQELYSPIVPTLLHITLLLINRHQHTLPPLLRYMFLFLNLNHQVPQ